MFSSGSDFDYHVTLPVSGKNPIPGNIISNGTTDLNGAHRSNKEPVVILFGWLGAADQHLSKYSDVFNNLGCITIRYTLQPQNMIVFRDKRLKAVCQRLLKLLEEIGVSSHPIFFHVMSNNGATMYSHFSKELINSKLNIRGCIFDSCPGQHRIYTVARAIHISTRGPFWLKCIAAVGGFMVLGVYELLRMGKMLLTGSLAVAEPWDLMEEPSRWSQLFLYTKKDDLIPYQDVELFAQHRKTLGVQVCTQLFQSEHVIHLKQYPVEYTLAVSEFLQMCLQDPDDK